MKCIPNFHFFQFFLRLSRLQRNAIFDLFLIQPEPKLAQGFEKHATLYRNFAKLFKSEGVKQDSYTFSKDTGTPSVYKGPMYRVCLPKISQKSRDTILYIGWMANINYSGIGIEGVYCVYIYTQYSR